MVIMFLSKSADTSSFNIAEPIYDHIVVYVYLSTWAIPLKKLKFEIPLYLLLNNFFYATISVIFKFHALFDHKKTIPISQVGKTL